MGIVNLNAGAPAHFRFHPNASTVTFDYLLAKSESKAAARNSTSVQTLEQVAIPRSVRMIDADAIVAHRELPSFARSHGGDVDLGHRLAPVLDRIANKVLDTCTTITSSATRVGNGSEVTIAPLC